jgi:hypothetical protein
VFGSSKFEVKTSIFSWLNPVLLWDHSYRHTLLSLLLSFSS